MILRQSAHAALVRGLTSNVSNAEVKPIQPFSCLAFPLLRPQKTALKRLILGNELVTSFIWIGNENTPFCANRFSAQPRNQTGLAHRRDSRHPVERGPFLPAIQTLQAETVGTETGGRKGIL